MINTSNGLIGVVNSLVEIFNSVLPVLVAMALVLFMYGVVKYIKSEGEHEERGIMLWSLVALFVILSMWGILRLMCNTFTGSGSCNNTPGADNAHYNTFRA